MQDELEIYQLEGDPNVPMIRCIDHIGAKGTIPCIKTFASESLIFVLQIAYSV